MGNDSQRKLSYLFGVLFIVEMLFKRDLSHFFVIVTSEHKAVEVRNRVVFDGDLDTLLIVRLFDEGVSSHNCMVV